MFRKYEKTYRIPVWPNEKYSQDKYLSKKDIDWLLNGGVVVEEKFDGANVGIITTEDGFHLQKRGDLIGTGEHEQYKFFRNWAMHQKYEQLSKIPPGFIIYGELLYAVHSIYYKELPDWFLVFDIWDGERYLNTDEKHMFCRLYGLHPVPLLAWGHLDLIDLVEIVQEESRFGDMSEGIVVKNYLGHAGFARNQGPGLRKGKIVKPEFNKMMEANDHWIHQPVRSNDIANPNKERCSDESAKYRDTSK